MLVAVDIDFTPFLSNFRILDFIRIFEGSQKCGSTLIVKARVPSITHQRPKTCEKRRGARSQRAVSALVPTRVPHILVHNGLAANVDAPLHLVRTTPNWLLSGNSPAPVAGRAAATLIISIIGFVRQTRNRRADTQCYRMLRKTRPCFSSPWGGQRPGHPN